MSAVLREPESLAPGIVLMPDRATREGFEAALTVIEAAPPRHFRTPNGGRMSVRCTNCGQLGWIADRLGYRYAGADPETGLAWPAMPAILRDLAVEAAEAAGFRAFSPDACLVNLYDAEARMGLHQDRNENDFSQPVVSISYGMSGRFRMGGTRRGDPSRTLLLHHGDILVFGGPARLMYHGVDRLDGPPDPILGRARLNLTFRRVTAGR